MASRFVKGYLRSYTTHDGRVVTDEPAEFREVQLNGHPYMLLHDVGLLRRDAEALIRHWNMQGETAGYSYRLED